MATFSWPGYAALRATLGRVAEPTYDDVRPLMEEWERIATEDNRRGVLAGLDKDGRPMKPTWRQNHEESRWVTKNGKRIRYRGWAEAGDGPPLAPQYEKSRVIANFETAHGRDQATGHWTVVAGWHDVENRKGDDFLKYHFSDAPRSSTLPRRDLRGIRPWGVALVAAALDLWARAFYRWEK